MTVGADERFVVISADCHAGGSMDTYGEYLDDRVPGPVRRRGAAPTATRSATCRARAASATGTATSASPSWRPTARSPRSSSPTPCRRSSRPARWSPGRRPPRTSSCAGPACGPTTGGWPTGAATSPTAGPASPRCSSTTSTRRSRRPAGSPRAGCKGGVLIPAVPDDCDIEPLYSEIYDPLWAVCEEHGLVVNSHSGSGHPDYGDHAGVDADLGHRDAVDGAPTALAHDARAACSSASRG